MREYNHKIAEEIVIYILKEGKINDHHRLFMVLYIADKLHMKRYGSLMFDEVYKAGPEGPVPTIVEDFINKAREGGTDKLYLKDDILICAKDFEVEHISEASIECLNDALSNETPLTTYKDAAWNRTELGLNMSIKKIASTLPNANELIEYLEDPYPEKKVPKNVQKPSAR